MRKILAMLTVAFVSMAMVVSAAEGDIVEWIVNGDFETGDFSGWNNASESLINSTTPLDGSYSADVAIGTGGDAGLRQEGFGIVSNATVSFVFLMADPGDATDRGFQMYLNELGINMRVVDGVNLDDGFGDVEFYTASGGGWIPVLADVVVFGATNAVSIAINGYGDDFDYDLSVNGSTASGLSYLHVADGVFNTLDAVVFRGQSSTVGFTVDNVSVIGPEPPDDPPEPTELVNGDFEATPFDTGWLGGPAVAVAGLVDGSSTAANLSGLELNQDFVPGAGSGLTNFVFDMVIKLDDLDGAQRLRIRANGNSGDVITLKWDGSGLYEYSSVWEIAIRESLEVDTAYRIRVTVEDGVVVYGLSLDGTNYVDSSEMTETHGPLIRGFETVTVSGNMSVDEISVGDGTVLPPPPAVPVTVTILVLDSTDELEVSWLTTNQLFYTLEASSNLVLGEASWNSITSNIPGVNGVITITEPMIEDQLFYRVITE